MIKTILSTRWGEVFSNKDGFFVKFIEDGYCGTDDWQRVIECLIKEKVVTPMKRDNATECYKLSLGNYNPIYPYEWAYGMFLEAFNLVLKYVSILEQFECEPYTINPYECIGVFGAKPRLIFPAFRKKNGESYAAIMDTISAMYLWPLKELRINSDVVRSIIKSNHHQMYTISDLENVHYGLAGTKIRQYRDKVYHHLPGWARKRMQSSLSKISKEASKLSYNGPKRDDWSGYLPENVDIDKIEQQDCFERYDKVAKLMLQIKPKTVVEMGGNKGLFAMHACRTVGSIERYYCGDYDEHAVNWLYNYLQNTNEFKMIYPMVLNFQDTYKKLWLRPLGDRIEADCCVAMALTHHLLLRQQVSIDIMFEGFASCTKEWLLVEFMPKGVWKTMERTYNMIPEYSFEWFKAHMEKRFDVKDVVEVIEGHRVLLIGKKRM